MWGCFHKLGPTPWSGPLTPGPAPCLDELFLGCVL